MGITFDDVREYVNKYRESWESMLVELEKYVIKERDNKSLPVYLTKWRVKKIDSIFMKTKRKKIANLDRITDYAGMRILCLFEQDVYDVHMGLMEILKQHDFSLKTLNIFNYEDEDRHISDKIDEAARKAFPKATTNPNRKESGYKSIHYIISEKRDKKTFYVEIQLRTLLQDVWAELEHSLSYKKGNIHPHIKKSFMLLAKDLQTDDTLMSHLKNISEKERFSDQYFIKKAGPHKYLEYENSLIPSFFKNGKTKKPFDKYSLFVREKDPKKSEWIETARKLYKEFITKCNSIKLDEDINAKYWVAMEKAYMLFCEGKYDESLEIYNDLVNKKDYETRYVLHFRIGEIEFIKGNIESSLVSFDRSEALLTEYCSSHFENHYRIKVKLAAIFWLLGSEYKDLAYKQILDAKEIFNKHKSKFSKSDSESLTNNLCWYTLEMYLGNEVATTKKRYYNLTVRYLKDLEKCLSSKTISSNAFDTVAWCYYHLYLKDNKKEYLDKAKECYSTMEQKDNKATFRLASNAIHFGHMQEIMTEK